MRRLQQFRAFFRAVAGLLLAFGRTAGYLRTKALADLALPAGSRLSPAEQRRWQHYAWGTTYLAAVFGLLLGRRWSPSESASFAQLAALACFFDDLTDRFPAQPGTTAADSPEQYGRRVDPRGLALHLLQRVEQGLPAERLPLFRHFLQRVFQVETAGRQRGARAPEAGELLRLTAEKGGCSVLLFRCLLAPPLSAAEQKALFEFGGLIQLCDDIFDLWFDRQNGTATLATTWAAQHRLSTLVQVFEQQVAATRQALQTAPFSGLQRASAAWAVHLLCAITRVCLQHYLLLQKKHGTLPLDSRADMVVDMGRWRHRWRAGLAIFQGHGWISRTVQQDERQ
ncbi:MAG: hypothetical protein IT260_13340 [Saprospiraceae bacterium]|nr:hypothetical protein [Saprospiraceae bacterium]